MGRVSKSLEAWQATAVCLSMMDEAAYVPIDD